MSDDAQAKWHSDAAVDGAAKELIEAGRSWESDAVEQARKTTKASYVIAAIGILAGVIGGSTSAYLSLTRKVVQPYLLQMDVVSGEMKQVTKLEDRVLSLSEAADTHWLRTYVLAREEFSDATIENNYDVVRLMSMPGVMKEYQLFLSPQNPGSPIAKYPSGVVDVTVTNYSFIGKGAAQVRFTRVVKGVTSPPPPSDWIATVGYAYEARNMSFEERSINFAGFTVNDYRIDEVRAAGTFNAGGR